MVQSCDEKRGRKLHEKNYDGRGQQMLQSRTTEEALERPDTRCEVFRLKIEHTGDRKKRRRKILMGGINSIQNSHLGKFDRSWIFKPSMKPVIM